MSSDPKAPDRGDQLFNSFARAPGTGGTPAGGGAPGGAEPSGAEKLPPGIWCSDCRTVMRTNYFALNDRPLCARCKPSYAAQIERGKGDGAMERAALYGLGAAVAGAMLLTGVIWVIGFGRLVCSVAIGFMVGKAVSHATGGYGGRRYQILAVTLTYFAVGVGNLTPVLIAVAGAAAEVHAGAANVAGARAGADTPAGESDDTGAEATDDEYAGEAGEEADEESDTEPVAELEAASREAARSPDERWAARLRAAGGLFTLIGGILMLLLTLPLLSAFAYGIYGAVAGIFALGYAIHKAWEFNENGIELKLSGPHRVGTGPIAPTVL